ncbi:MAG: hypothetical protein HON47_04410 [Candidatus Diapherotrites archaeon]|jgi:hypothetical protein|uniref:Class III signal peptide-containing protein n=1 Tax=Candidatus Iainarchaeum sp. TaxID=3101447 RepID=A0A8T5GFX8_9ARCH|nr:hypothetical protein [Candidatus Diapherotrites archaeon]MBT7240890.1 hypothetical protein [Candidatus Diapherotrites archaeon]
MEGQASIESLFLLLVIITSVIFILGLYSQTHDSTVGISIVRTQVTSLANSMDEMVIIKKVSLNRMETGENIFVIKTDPSTLNENDFGTNNLDEITNQILSSTRLINIEYQIN